MKKLIGYTLFVVFGVCLFSIAPVPEAQAAYELTPKPEPAQVIYSINCCDGNAIIRCKLINWTPVGNACFCNGQGWGYAC